MKLPRPLFSRFQVGAFVLPCKLLPKEAKLGDPVTLTLGSANEFLVGVEPKIPPRGRRHGPPSRPSKGSFSTSAKVGGESLASAERQGWRRRCWVSTEAAQPPQPKLKRAPLLWTLLQEQPRTWCTSPTPGAATRPPHLRTAQTQRHPRGDQQSPFLSPRNLTISVRQEDSWPLQARPGGQPSFPRCLPKVLCPEPLCGSLHGRGHNVFFLTEHVKACDCLAKFLSYRTMEPSVFCQGERTRI